MAFSTKPLGALTDCRINNEGRPNRDWSPIREVRTGRIEGAWTVEMTIPFRSLRYRTGRNQMWEIQLRHSVLRRNEWNHLTWLPTPADGMGSPSTAGVSMYGTSVAVLLSPRTATSSSR